MRTPARPFWSFAESLRRPLPHGRERPLTASLPATAGKECDAIADVSWSPPMRIALIHISQETNDFNPQLTTLADFKAFGIYEGEEIVRARHDRPDRRPSRGRRGLRSSSRDDPDHPRLRRRRRAHRQRVARVLPRPHPRGPEGGGQDRRPRTAAARRLLGGGRRRRRGRAGRALPRDPRAGRADRSRPRSPRQRHGSHGALGRRDRRHIARSRTIPSTPACSERRCSSAWCART